MTRNYLQKTYNECVYFEEHTTCLLMDKFFPKLQLHSLNKGMSVYDKVA